MYSGTLTLRPTMVETNGFNSEVVLFLKQNSTDIQHFIKQ